MGTYGFFCVLGCEGVSLYSAYVDTPQNTRKSRRIYGIFLTCFVVVFMLLFDDLEVSGSNFGSFLGSF